MSSTSESDDSVADLSCHISEEDSSSEESEEDANVDAWNSESEEESLEDEEEKESPVKGRASQAAKTREKMKTPTIPRKNPPKMNKLKQGSQGTCLSVERSSSVRRGRPKVAERRS